MPHRLILTAALAAAPTVAFASSPAPVCPAGFAVASASETSFECRVAVAPHMAVGAARIAGQTGCPRPRYWNFGPHVTATDRGGHAIVAWTCYHMKG